MISILQMTPCINLKIGLFALPARVVKENVVAVYTGWDLYSIALWCCGRRTFFIVRSVGKTFSWRRKTVGPGANSGYMASFWLEGFWYTKRTADFEG